jgi:hypothetical protein
MKPEGLSEFYRVLSSPSHVAGWNHTPVLNSSHHRPPVRWIQQWTTGTGKGDLDLDYPLCCEEFGKKVRFTASARKVYLAEPTWFIARNLDVNPRRWFEVGELEGICAFTSPQECFTYGELNPRLPHLYVVFLGEAVCDVPENTGVVAKVMKKLGNPQSPGEFSRNYVHVSPRPTV